MSSPITTDSARGRCILVADEDPKVVAFIIDTLRADGHAVFHAYDGLSATELAFTLGDAVDLVISNTRVKGTPGIELIYLIRSRLANLPIMYIANIDRSTPAIEAKLPRNVPILREPFTAEELRARVGSLLAGEPGLLAPDDLQERT
jgi:two-component system, OmpR family, response regulator